MRRERRSEDTCETWDILFLKNSETRFAFKSTEGGFNTFTESDENTFADCWNSLFFEPVCEKAEYAPVGDVP